MDGAEVLESQIHSPADSSPKPGHAKEVTEASKGREFNQFSICALSITTVIGGQYYGWNESLQNGFGAYGVGQALMALAYLIYVCSIAEIVSGFPFSGGGYGLARVAQGYWVGFLVGCCESLEYIAYSAMSFIYVSEVICFILGINTNYSLIFCFLCYVVTLTITIKGGRMLQYTNYVLAFLSLTILLFFCFGTMPWVDFDTFASLHQRSSTSSINNWFRGGMSGFLAVLPDTTAAYGGIEALCLLPSFTDNPKASIPRGLLFGWLVLFVSNVLVVFVMASMPGGIEETSGLDFPMHVGFSLLFKCTRIGTMILMLPAQFAMGYGFVLPYSKLLQSLGTTNLLPSVFRLNHCSNHHNAAIVGSIIGFVICCICEYWTDVYLPHICILAGFLTYVSQLHGYYMLKTQYANSTREFTSPFGLAGVLFSLIVFLLGIVAMFGFCGEYVTVTFMVTFLVVLSVYYHFFAAKTQTLAEEEQAVLFQLHVAKVNRRKKHHQSVKHSSTFSKKKVVPSHEDSENSRRKVESNSQNSHSYAENRTISSAFVPRDMPIVTAENITTSPTVLMNSSEAFVDGNQVISLYENLGEEGC